jgi:hypothetical protein
MRAKTAVCPLLIDLMFTGRRRDDHYRIDMDGRAVWLPLASFGVVVELVCAAIQTESGLVPVGRGTIYHLRKSIDAVLGAGAAVQLIATGAGEEYRLTILKAKIRRRVGIAPCFYELEGLQIVTKEQAALLRKHCAKRKLRETEEWPSGD